MMMSSECALFHFGGSGDNGGGVLGDEDRL